MEKKEPYIKVTKDGPYLVYGVPKIAEEIIVVDERGISIEYAKGRSFEVKGDPERACVALCRCGHSENAPYCDGAHEKKKWKGKEKASFDDLIDDAELIEGPNYTLIDNQNYCAYARFCDAKGTIWSLIEKGTEEADKQAIKEAFDCPAGRLVVMDNESGKQLEPKLEKEIAVLEDIALDISGPLWVKGGIRIESEDGRSYEVRNRQTLCRCGQSTYKPFCNGVHPTIKWKAKYKEDSK